MFRKAATAATSSSTLRLGTSTSDRNDSSLAPALSSVIWRGRTNTGTPVHTSSTSSTRCLWNLFLVVMFVCNGIMLLHLHGSLLKTSNAEQALQLPDDEAIQLNQWHLRQLSFAYDQIRSLALQSRPQSPVTAKPPLDVSIFSKPPQKPTLPTQFEHAPNMGDPNQSPYICRLYQSNGKENTAANSATHQWALARMVVFQKNGGKQLVTWVTHYLHVLPPDALVLIDHASTDPWTLSLLHEYAMLGMHVWYCPSGSYEYGREVMWSTIAIVYKQDSAFIFPLDVDELVTVNDNADSIALDKTKDATAAGTKSSDAKLQRRLVWDTHSFYHALDHLGTTGKPFKMEQADVVPGDCHLPLHDGPNVDPEKSSPPPKRPFPSLVCSVTHAPTSTQPIPFSCMHKNFCRGPDFVQTDLGNHFLVTNWTVSTVPDLKFSGYNIVHQCEQDGVYQWYEPSSLVLLHLQRLEFADWFLHYLRGASMHGYTYFECLDPSQCLPQRGSALL
jgi:hypothetical protein